MITFDDMLCLLQTLHILHTNENVKIMVDERMNEEQKSIGGVDKHLVKNKK